jgi:hypothetical protein
MVISILDRSERIFKPLPSAFAQFGVTPAFHGSADLLSDFRDCNWDQIRDLIRRPVIFAVDTAVRPPSQQRLDAKRKLYVVCDNTGDGCMPQEHLQSLLVVHRPGNERHAVMLRPDQILGGEKAFFGREEIGLVLEEEIIQEL